MTNQQEMYNNKNSAPDSFLQDDLTKMRRAVAVALCLVFFIAVTSAFDCKANSNDCSQHVTCESGYTAFCEHPPHQSEGICTCDKSCSVDTDCHSGGGCLHGSFCETTQRVCHCHHAPPPTGHPPHPDGGGHPPVVGK